MQTWRPRRVLMAFPILLSPRVHARVLPAWRVDIICEKTRPTQQWRYDKNQRVARMSSSTSLLFTVRRMTFIMLDVVRVLRRFLLQRSDSARRRKRCRRQPRARRRRRARLAETVAEEVEVVVAVLRVCARGREAMGRRGPRKRKRRRRAVQARSSARSRRTQWFHSRPPRPPRPPPAPWR